MYIYMYNLCVCDYFGSEFPILPEAPRRGCGRLNPPRHQDDERGEYMDTPVLELLCLSHGYLVSAHSWKNDGENDGR